MNLKSKSFKAFSLLEASIVLCIMGIALSMTLPSLIQYTLTHKKSTSLQKIEKIQKVLAAYVYEHGCLPNPSFAHQNIGISNPSLSKGVIPFLTLGLTENDAQDSFQRFYTYVIQPDISCAQKTISTSTQSLLNFCKTPLPTVSKSITIITRRNTSLGINLDQKDFISYVLIFHGESGGGSHTDTGIIQDSNHHIKQQNSISSTRLQECTLDKNCDDQLFWTTRNNLVTMHFDTTCAKLKDDEIKQISNTTNTSNPPSTQNDIEDPR